MATIVTLQFPDEEDADYFLKWFKKNNSTLYVNGTWMEAELVEAYIDKGENDG